MSEYTPQDTPDTDEATDVEGHVKPEGDEEGKHFLNELPDGEGKHFRNETDAGDDDTPDVEGHRMHRP